MIKPWSLFRTDPFHPTFRGVTAVCSEENDPAPDPGAGGGGGGDDPPAVTLDAVTQLVNDTVSKQVNGALNSYFTRGKFKETLAESIGSVVDSKLEGFKPPEPPPADPDAGKGKKATDENELRVKKLEAALADQQKKFTEMEAEKQKASDKAKTTKEVSDLRAALSKEGVPDGLIEGASAYLYHAQGAVDTDDEGNVCLVVVRDYAPDGELTPINDGVKEWLTTDVGKGYLPPRDTGGSGNRGGRQVVKRKPGEQKSHEENMQDVGMALVNHMAAASGVTT